MTWCAAARDPLHDAPIEVGRPDLATHCREPDHPRGCWVLDLLLGKE